MQRDKTLGREWVKVVWALCISCYHYHHHCHHHQHHHHHRGSSHKLRGVLVALNQSWYLGIIARASLFRNEIVFHKKIYQFNECNVLPDLSPLSNLPHLLALDASHNCISVMLDFTPPLNLQDVDLSFNQLTTMGDLSAHHALKKLVLDSILWWCLLVKAIGAQASNVSLFSINPSTNQLPYHCS